VWCSLIWLLIKNKFELNVKVMCDIIWFGFNKKKKETKEN